MPDSDRQMMLLGYMETYLNRANFMYYAAVVYKVPYDALLGTVIKYNFAAAQDGDGDGKITSITRDNFWMADIEIEVRLPPEPKE